MLIATLVAFVSFSVSAGSMYSKLTVTAEAGKGTVYVSSTSDKPVDSDFKESTSASVSTEYKTSKPNSVSHTYYVYAQPAENYIFSCWEGTGVTASNKTVNGGTVTVSATSNTQSSPTAFDWKAIFVERPPVVVSSSLPGSGTVAIDKIENKIGQVVTLTASVPKIPAYNQKNQMIDFVCWRDSEGNVLSTDAKYSFTVTEPIEIIGEFRDKNAIKTSGYYRVRNIFSHAMSVEGGFVYSDIKGNSNFLNPYLLRWAIPVGLPNSDFGGSSMWEGDVACDNVESMPSTVLYMSGKVGNLDAAPGETMVSDIVGYAQGVQTDVITRNYKLTLTRAAANAPGYYCMPINGMGGLKIGVDKVTHPEKLQRHGVLAGAPDITTPYCWMAVQPIDEEHVDDFWFGAAPAEEMFFEGGYWTSMYTSFPYRCYEPDGVEAYYAKEVATAGGQTYVQLEKIESGVVPAKSAVLLKCKGLDTKENRLIPLEPYDGDFGVLEGNLLKGEFQIYTDAKGNGRKLFDPATMRVFALGGEGAPGFFVLAPDANGSQRELAANRAYLDLTLLPAEARVAGLRISTVDFSGVEDVVADPGAAASDSGVIYDLYGRRVANPVAGTIYIVDGKKRLWR